MLKSTEKPSAISEINFGHPKVFQQQYELYFSALKFFSLKYINDTDIVCDLIQDIFVKLWSSHQEFKNEIAVKVFLYRSIRNSCLNYIRDCKSHNRLHQIMDNTDSEAPFINNIIEAEIYVSVKTAFNMLPPLTKEIYQLSLNGTSHAEIADLLQISVNTVKKHKNKANHLLRERLKDLFLTIFSICH